MPKKPLVIIISIVAVILIAGGVTAGLVFFKGSPTQTNDTDTDTTAVIENDPTKSDPSLQESLTTPDLSTDLGACTVVTKEMLTTAFGENIATISDAVNRGYAKAQDETGSQSCTFAFSEDDAINNRYSTTVTLFNDDKSKETAIQAYDSESIVEGISEAAYFTTTEIASSDTVEASTNYTLSVFKDMKLYVFDISVPSANDTFTESSAKDALVSLEKLASY